MSLLLTLTATLSAPLLGGTIVVHPTDNLIEAVASASPGDVLLLADGVYHVSEYETRQHDNRAAFVIIDKDITIAAQNVGRAVMDGGAEDMIGGVLAVHAGTVVLRGLNITGGFLNGPGGGVQIVGNATRVDIQNCNIFKNTAGRYVAHISDAMPGGGVYIDKSTVTFENCSLYDNYASDMGGGAVCIWDGTVDFKNCNFHGNKALDGGGGGACIHAGTVTFDKCHFHGNHAEGCSGTYGGGVYLYDGHMVVQECKINKNTEKHDDYNICEGGGGGIAISNFSSPYAHPTFSIDDKTVVDDNEPEDCYGFSHPACIH